MSHAGGPEALPRSTTTWRLEKIQNLIINIIICNKIQTFRMIKEQYIRALNV